MVGAVFQNIKISGLMTAVPKHRETIREKYQNVFGEEAVNQFVKSTGVKERRAADEQQTASDLVFVAARELLQKKEILKEEIGILIFVTQCPDYKMPATACVLHKRLELSKNCISFDMNLGCSGYVYGIQTAASLLQSTNSHYALLLVADTLTKLTAPEDKTTVMLFGDAGSATLLEKMDNVEMIHTVFSTDGRGFKDIIIPAGGSRNQQSLTERTVWGDGILRSDYDIYMNGIDVFSFTISEVPQMIREYIEQIGVDREAYDAFVFHQANGFILKQIMKKCKLTEGKLPISLDRYGNTSVASIPTTICDKYGTENISQTLRMLACGFGVGLSWGIVDFYMNICDIYPIIETDEFFEEGSVSHD